MAQSARVNECGHSERPHRARGRCRACYEREWRATPPRQLASRVNAARYRATPEGRLARRGQQARRIASGAAAVSARRSRANIAAYTAEVFAESPEKRIVAPDSRVLVVLNDIQFPFEDPGALNQALDVVRMVNPDTIVLNGDVIDCYLESKFTKLLPRAQLARVASETYERSQQFMAAVAAIPTKFWLGGNHEARWGVQIANEIRHRGISPISQALLAGRGKDINLDDASQSFARVYGMHEHGFTYYPWGHRLYFAERNLIVTHGKYVSRHAGYAAKRTVEWLGTSVIVGHTHRLAFAPVTQDGVIRGGWENGCLCQREPEYDDAPNWQQGLSVVKIDGPEFHVIQVPIVRRKGEAVAVYHG